MRKQLKTFLIINILVVFCICSHGLYAKDLHFIAYGDTRRDVRTMEMPQVKHNAIARVIRQMSPDFILFSGDMVYRNEFERFLEVITSNYMGDKMIPLYPVIGNHELIFGEKIDSYIAQLREWLKKAGVSGEQKDEFAPSANPLIIIQGLHKKLYVEINSITESRLKTRSSQVLREEFKNRLNPAYTHYLEEVLGKTTNGPSWYSFVREVNGLKIKFIAINSLLPDDEEQYQWFLGELRQFGGPKIVIEHYPVYSLGLHGFMNPQYNKSKEMRFRDRYARVFNDVSNNILLVISGHDHNYQRICKTDKKGGIKMPVYIVSGGGGADLTGEAKCNISQSQIYSDGFQCMGLITAYQFVDVIAYTDDENNLALKCKVLGLRCDLAKGLPDDDTFERLFVKERLELIDDFTLNWQR